MYKVVLDTDDAGEAGRLLRNIADGIERDGLTEDRTMMLHDSERGMRFVALVLYENLGKRRDAAMGRMSVTVL